VSSCRTLSCLWLHFVLVFLNGLDVTLVELLEGTVHSEHKYTCEFRFRFCLNILWVFTCANFNYFFL
jgi:hypothetical protein